jgi:hypothetical protein
VRDVARDILRTAREVVSGYYSPEGSMSLGEVLDRWANQGDKIYDSAMPIYYPVSKLWPHREYTWSRNKSRSGHARVKGKNVYLTGPLKWDALKADMAVNGWDPDEPLYVDLGLDGNMKVAEGNHRLAIARELGMGKVPVWFSFYREAKKQPEPHGEPVELDRKTVKKMVEGPKRKLTPEEEALTEELMEIFRL